MHDINSEKLINAIKVRPALYNKNDPNYYSNRKYKSKLWAEVCKDVFSQWDDFKPQDKVENCHELQRRWKSLRTCFTRELQFQRKERLAKERNEGPIKRRKRYGYFNKLTFLLSEQESDLTRESEDESSTDPLETMKEEQIAYQSTNIAPSSSSRSSKFEVEVDPEPEPLYRPVFNNTVELEDKVLDMMKEIKKDEEDEDRQFMLSLVPSFRKLDRKQKFEARIEILRVLKDITFKDD